MRSSSALLTRRSAGVREMLARGAARWPEQLRAAGRAGSLLLDPSVELHVIEVELRGHPDPTLRQELLSIQTTLSLPGEDVDKLIAAGGRLQSGPDTGYPVVSRPQSV